MSILAYRADNLFCGETGKGTRVVLRRLARSNLFVLGAYIVCSVIVTSSLFFLVLHVSANRLPVSSAGIAPLLACLQILYAANLLVRYKTLPSLSFIVVAAPALLLFSWFILPDQVPDEIWHIYRSFTVFEDIGTRMVVPDIITYQELPVNYVDYLGAFENSSSWVGVHEVTRDMSAYLSHLYFFSGVGACIGKFLQLNVFFTIWLARISNAAAYLAAGYWVLKVLPFGKSVGFVYLLNPMLLELEASCSADAVLNSVCLLYIAFYLRCLIERPVSHNNLIGMIVCLGLTAVSKYAYALLAILLLAFVPRIKDKSRRLLLYIATVCGLVIIIAAVLIWYSPTQGTEIWYALGLVRAPLSLLTVYIKTIWEQLPLWISSFAGGNLGAFTVSTWPPCLWAYLILITVSILVGPGEDVNPSRWTRLFHGIFSTILILLLALPFRKWSIEVDGRADIIQGVQGRYFLPFSMLPLATFVRRDFHIVRESCYLSYGVILAVIIIIDTISITITFI